MIPHRRKLGTVLYQASSRQTLNLDVGDVCARLWLRLRYTVTNGAVAPVGPFFQTLSRLIQRAEVIVGGRDTVWSITGADLAMRVQLEKASPAYGADATISLVANNVSTYDVVLPIDFVLPRSRRPDDCALDLRGVSTAVLAITWGPSDCSDFYTTPNAAAISAVTLAVEATYMIGVDSKATFLVREMKYIEASLAASSNAFFVLLDRRTGLIYRSMLIVTQQDRVGVNTVLDNGNGVQLLAGQFVFFNGLAVVLKGENRVTYNQGWATTAVPAGVYFIDDTLFGQIVTGLDTSQLGADLKAYFDATYTAGVTLIRAQTEAVRPLMLA